jgi:hypothetical protein
MRGKAACPCGARLERNQMICDGFGSFGSDADGRMTRTSYLYYIEPSVWGGSFFDMGGRFGDHAYFQGNGNYVV